MPDVPKGNAVAYIHRAGISGIYRSFHSSALPGRDATLPDMQRTIARHLDLQADVELSHGHHRAAERLSRLADEMRGRRA